MPKFISREVEVTAVQWDGTTEGAKAIYNEMRKNIFYGEKESFPPIPFMVCYTKRGQVSVKKGDYLVIGEGETYPIPEDVFLKKYRPA